MSLQKERVVINSNDIILILGCSETTARRKLQETRDSLSKKPGAPVTFKEFCDDQGLNLEEVLQKCEIKNYPGVNKNKAA